jgi:hypothetical protein
LISSSAVHSRLPRAAHSVLACAAVTYSPLKLPLIGGSKTALTSLVQTATLHALLSNSQHWIAAVMASRLPQSEQSVPSAQRFDSAPSPPSSHSSSLTDDATPHESSHSGSVRVASTHSATVSLQ